MTEQWSLYRGDYRDAPFPEKMTLIVTSPPYNIGTKGPRRDQMRKEGRYAAKSFAGITGYPDALPEDVYQKQQIEFLVWAADHLAPGGTLVYNHKPRQRQKTIIDPHEWLLAEPVRERLVEATYPVVWDRGSTHNNGAGQLWQTTERLYIMRRAEDTGWCIRNRRKRGLLADWQRDLWSIPLSRREATKLGHCAPFPLELADRAVMLFTEPGDLVGDPYAGTGTTGIAALQRGRRFAGAELQDDYYETASQRLEEAAR